MSDKFIRLDIKGQWRGVEHQSRFVAWFETEDNRDLEDGISCYYANVEGIKDLWHYANKRMSLDEKDFKNMQLTIFEGNWSGKGSDDEELAWCTKTIAEKDAYEWYKKMCIAYEKHEGDFFNEDLDDYENGISDEEYEKLIIEATGI